MLSLPEIVRKIYSSYLNSVENNDQLTRLQTSFNPLPNIKKVPKEIENASIYTLIHYTLIIIVFVFSISIMPVDFAIKFLLIAALFYINFAPIFAQFFGNALPILSWVFLFFNSKFIPLSLKRPISVKVLPALETIFYGDNLSEILASKTNTLFDIIAWLPYGLIHFSLPFVVAFLIFVFAPPKTLPQFCWSFGFMNLAGVVIQDLVFSCAPPWYKVLHGLENADYTMKGSPGGLGRIDTLLGIDMYTTGFTNSPLIFGAMPSLHSGCSTMDCLWLCYLLPKASPIWITYVVWLWFSTMYLTHHYFIDVVVGSCLAVFFFSCVKWRGRLPINDRFCRWDYSFENLKYHSIWNEDPLKTSESAFAFELGSDLQNISNNLEFGIPMSDLTKEDESANDHEYKGEFHINDDDNDGDNGDKEENSNSDNEYFNDDAIPISEEIGRLESSLNKPTKTNTKYYKESFETISNYNNSENMDLDNILKSSSNSN